MIDFGAPDCVGDRLRRAGALRGGGAVLEPVVVRDRRSGLVRGQVAELVRLESIARYGELVRRRLVGSI